MNIQQQENNHKQPEIPAATSEVRKSVGSMNEDEQNKTGQKFQKFG